MSVKVIHMGQMALMPPKPDVCQVCATAHAPELPHNLKSLYYQVSFEQQHRRYPVWSDAMAHCTQEIQDQWLLALAEHEEALATAKDKENNDG